MKAKSRDEMTRNICEDQAQGLETKLWYKNQVQGSSRRLKSGMMLGKNETEAWNGEVECEMVICKDIAIDNDLVHLNRALECYVQGRST